MDNYNSSQAIDNAKLKEVYDAYGDVKKKAQSQILNHKDEMILTISEKQMNNLGTILSVSKNNKNKFTLGGVLNGLESKGIEISKGLTNLTEKSSNSIDAKKDAQIVELKAQNAELKKQLAKFTGQKDVTKVEKPEVVEVASVNGDTEVEITDAVLVPEASKSDGDTNPNILGTDDETTGEKIVGVVNGDIVYESGLADGGGEVVVSEKDAIPVAVKEKIKNDSEFVTRLIDKGLTFLIGLFGSKKQVEKYNEENPKNRVPDIEYLKNVSYEEVKEGYKESLFFNLKEKDISVLLPNIEGGIYKYNFGIKGVQNIEEGNKTDIEVKFPKDLTITQSIDLAILHEAVKKVFVSGIAEKELNKELLKLIKKGDEKIVEFVRLVSEGKNVEAKNILNKVLEVEEKVEKKTGFDLVVGEEITVTEKLKKELNILNIDKVKKIGNDYKLVKNKDGIMFLVNSKNEKLIASLSIKESNGFTILGDGTEKMILNNKGKIIQNNGKDIIGHNDFKVLQNNKIIFKLDNGNQVLVDENGKNILGDNIGYEEIYFVKDGVYIVKNAENSFSLVGDDNEVIDGKENYYYLTYFPTSKKIKYREKEADKYSDVKVADIRVESEISINEEEKKGGIKIKKEGKEIILKKGQIKGIEKIGNNGYRLIKGENTNAFLDNNNNLIAYIGNREGKPDYEEKNGILIFRADLAKEVIGTILYDGEKIISYKGEKKFTSVEFIDDKNILLLQNKEKKGVSILIDREGNAVLGGEDQYGYIYRELGGYVGEKENGKRNFYDKNFNIFEIDGKTDFDYFYIEKKVEGSIVKGTIKIKVGGKEYSFNSTNEFLKKAKIKGGSVAGIKVESGVVEESGSVENEKSILTQDDINSKKSLEYVKLKLGEIIKKYPNQEGLLNVEKENFIKEFTNKGYTIYGNLSLCKIKIDDYIKEFIEKQDNENKIQKIKESLGDDDFKRYLDIIQNIEYIDQKGSVEDIKNEILDKINIVRLSQKILKYSSKESDESIIKEINKIKEEYESYLKLVNFGTSKDELKSFISTSMFIEKDKKYSDIIKEYKDKLIKLVKNKFS